MPKMPVISGKALIKKLEIHGYSAIRQKGSHVRLRHQNPNLKPITVPLHNEIKTGLLKQILKDAGLSQTDLENL